MAGQKPEKNPCPVILAAEEHHKKTQSFGTVINNKVEYQATLGDVAHAIAELCAERALMRDPAEIQHRGFDIDETFRHVESSLRVLAKVLRCGDKEIED